MHIPERVLPGHPRGSGRTNERTPEVFYPSFHFLLPLLDAGISFEGILAKAYYQILHSLSPNTTVNSCYHSLSVAHNLNAEHVISWDGIGFQIYFKIKANVGKNQIKTMSV